jgi:hypothetical protein
MGRIADGVRVRLMLLALALLLLSGCTAGSRITPTPTAVLSAPVVIATTVPTLPPQPIRPVPTPTLPPSPQAALPTPVPVAQQRPLYVTNTGADGLTLRRAPAADGERIAVLPNGAAVTPMGPEQQADGRSWRQVRDAQGREGWVASELLSASPPAASSASDVPTSVAPTAPATQAIAVPLRPSTPTRAPTRVLETPRPVGTAAPNRFQPPAVIVAPTTLPFVPGTPRSPVPAP